MRGFLVLLACVLCAARAELLVKRLAGPPSEFGAMRMPSPVNAALAEESALLPVRFAAGAAVHEQAFAVDSKTEFQLVLYSPSSATLELQLFMPDGAPVPNLDEHREDGKWPVGSSGQMVAAPGWRFENPARGMWRAVVTQKRKGLPLRAAAAAPPVGHPDAYLFLWNDSEERIFSHMGTYWWATGQTVGVVANMFLQNSGEELERGVRPAPLAGAVIKSATLDVYTPTGEELTVKMQDDGSSFDLLANDHVYGGKFAVAAEGMYRVTTLFEGVLEDGTPFMRSAEHAMVSVVDKVEIVHGATARVSAAQAENVNRDQVSILVPVEGPEGLQVRTYAEVYGTVVGGGGALKAACWVGGYTNIAQGAVEFELNKKWLAAAGVEAPLVLRQVAIYDADVHVPLSVAAEVAMERVAMNVRRSPTAAAEPPTEEMLKGVRPAHLYPHVARARRQQANATLPSLVLLHGYCAKDNPWTRNQPVDFAHFVAYEGFLEKSVLNNVYAQGVIEDHGDLPSWGLVGHSQGGLVALHLHNFYWSPNDAVGTTGRPVQSMGTPYQGVSGTGAALDLGALFGIGCGDNFDLSTDGANLWQAGLQSAAKKDVWYYTTMWKKTFLHPRYCNLATNLVLDWPNDGMAEQIRAQLPEGHAVENPYEGECHTTGMKWPAQTMNARRNKEINDNAAR